MGGERLHSSVCRHGLIGRSFFLLRARKKNTRFSRWCLQFSRLFCCLRTTEFCIKVQIYPMRIRTLHSFYCFSGKLFEIKISPNRIRSGTNGALRRRHTLHRFRPPAERNSRRPSPSWASGTTSIVDCGGAVGGGVENDRWPEKWKGRGDSKTAAACDTAAFNSRQSISRQTVGGISRRALISPSLQRFATFSKTNNQTARPSI